jgi:amino acid transporter
LQNKKFWLKLHRTMLQWTFITQSIIFILYLLLHMKMKKLLVGAFLWMFAVAWVAVLPNQVSATGGWANPSADTNLIHGSQTLTGSAFLDTVRNAINWIMGILATVALVMCLYGWFKMVTAAW